jgi:hypothetical protein
MTSIDGHEEATTRARHTSTLAADLSMRFIP